jgi:HK97 family phage major capsid protein
MARKTSADIKAEIAEQADNAEALLAVAKEQDRDLSADELTEFNGYSANIDGLKTELEGAEDFEAKRRVLAEVRTLQSSTPSLPSTTPRTAANRLHAQVRCAPMRAFKGEAAQRDAYDCGQWLKAVMAQLYRSRDEDAEARVNARGWGQCLKRGGVMGTATEGNPGGGGYLVPTPLSNAIIDIRAAAGISRQVARVIPMNANDLSIPKKLSGTTVYYPGEAGAITPSDQTWGQIGLNAKKRAILSYVSNELRDDAIINVMDDLASQMGQDFAVKEDSEFILGDGTSTYGGEVGLATAVGAGGVVTAATGHDTWPEIDLPDLSAAMGALPSKWRPYQPAWITSASFYHSVMVRLLLAAPGNRVADLEGGAGGRPTFSGYPVYFTDLLPTTTAAATIMAFFGAFSQAVIIGDRTGIRIDQSEHAAFENDVVAIRGTTRYDINVHEPGTASVAGAYIALKTAA